MRKPWGRDSRTTMHVDKEMPTYHVMDAHPTGVGKPPAVEMFRLGMFAGVGFFLAALLISLAGGERLSDAFRLALKVGGISMGVVWPLLIFIYVSDDVGRTLNAIMAARLRKKEIDAMVRVRLAEIEMQKVVSLARAEIEVDRAQVAQKALIVGSANMLPSGNTPYDPAEKALIEAVKVAYNLADQDGYIPNTGPAPFSRRVLGDSIYSEVRRRLRAPGEKFGVVGSAPVATYDQGRKQWRLNLRSYPTYSDALMALTGRRPDGLGGGGGGASTSPPGDGGGENGREVIDWQ